MSTAIGHYTTIFGYKNATSLAISSGAITVVQALHIIEAETGTEDDLDTITAGDAILETGYRPLIMIQADTGDTITLKHGTGNLDFESASDIVLTDDAWCMLLYDGTNWQNINVVPQKQTYTVTNWNADRALDCDAAAVAELCDVVGTLIQDLTNGGFIDGDVSA